MSRNEENAGVDHPQSAWQSTSGSILIMLLAGVIILAIGYLSSLAAIPKLLAQILALAVAGLAITLLLSGENLKETCDEVTYDD